jgi:hypothetical protein
VASSRVFLLDANVFIEAKRRYYAFELCPGFWDCLVWHHGTARIQSIDRVKQELERGGDDLSDWVASAMPEQCFASTNNMDVTGIFGQMVTWVQGQAQFLSGAKAEFSAGSDGWLIAYAKANNLVLVTHEIFAPDARRKVPIPNVCEAFGVIYVDTFSMLKELNVAFSWEPPA